MHRKFIGCIAAVAVAIALGGCAALVGKATSGLADDLSAAILDSDDPAVVRDGAPAFLIMLDALLRSGDGNADLLRAAAALNGAYATAFVDEPQRRRAFADKALALARKAACADMRWSCEARAMPFEAFERQAAQLRPRDVPAAYALATAWAGWIEARADDWQAVAEFGRVKALMARVLELDERYDNGGPHLYMGVFETVLPPSVGGRPDLARAHFERVLEITRDRHLFAKVLFAENYARLLFDRELHDALLRDVLAADIRAPGLTLMNAIAQQRARELLDSADDYF